MVGTDHVKPEDLYVKSITVDPAPSAKRIRFQSMGRVFRYRKRHSHLTVVLEERATASAQAPTVTKDKSKPAAEGASGEAQGKKAAPRKAKSAAKKSAKKAPAKAASKAPAKGKKAAPAKKAKKTK
jgi:large subunit ribosomal protein L22